MELVFNKIESDKLGYFASCGIWDIYIFKYWLLANGVYSDEKNLRFEYNSAWDFYDVHIFPSDRVTVEELKSKILKLQDKCTIRRIDDTWRW